LTFLAAFALNDELRDGVNEVVSKLFRGGVNVRMISGDNLDTAVEVAKKAGILQNDDDKYEKVCMLGKDFREAVGGVRKVMDAAGNEKWEVVNKPNFRAIA
jgi:magnesium-transporting ATPase (P-type)